MSGIRHAPFNSPLPDTPVVTPTPEQEQKVLDVLDDILADIVQSLGRNWQAAAAVAMVNGRYQAGLAGALARTVETQVLAAWRSLDALRVTLLQVQVQLDADKKRCDQAAKLALLSEEA